MPQLIAIPIAAATGLAATSTAVVVSSSIIAALATTAVSFGVSSLLAPSPPSSGISDTPIKQIVKQSTPFERYLYGRALVGAAIDWEGKAPPYLEVQYLVAAHACDALEAVYINGYRCEFSSDGKAITPRFRRNGVPYLEISVRLGDPDQPVDPLLAAEFPDVPTTFRQRGHTVVTLKAYYGDDYDDHEKVWGGGQFAPRFLFRGKPVYDPRDSRQDRDDEATWRWSDNWALCLTDWVRSPYGGRKLATQIDYAAVAAEADLCDQGIGLSTGGAEARYTINGGFSSDENPFTILDGLLNAGGESAAMWRRGLFAPMCDVPRTAVRTLTQYDLVGPFSFRSSRPRNSTLNTVRSEFVFPGRNYKSAQTPPLIDSLLVSSDGQPLESTVRRPYVAGEERAQRLDKITLRRTQLGKELKFPIGVRHLDLEVGDQINIEMEDFSFLNGAYLIRSTTWDDAMQRIDLVMTEAATEEVHLWDTSEVQSTDLIDVIDEAA